MIGFRFLVDIIILVRIEFYLFSFIVSLYFCYFCFGNNLYLGI